MAMIDLERLRETGATPAALRQIVDLFFRQAEEKMAILHSAAKQKDARQWQEALHYLRGSALNMGMGPLATQCGAAEKAQPQTALLTPIRASLDATKTEADNLFLNIG